MPLYPCPPPACAFRLLTLFGRAGAFHAGFSAGASTRTKSHSGSRPCGRCFYDCCSSACPYCTWVEWVKDDGCFCCSLKTLVEIFLGCCCLFDCSAPCSGAPPKDAVKVWVMNRNSYW